uniref:Uncharacterized protein n=1 Tax=Zea mays TaxID=4577 RepID=B4FLZ7_MAIZE|nr:unknown [Zea mays]ACR37048.1 unknown [Zea mays]
MWVSQSCRCRSLPCNYTVLLLLHWNIHCHCSGKKN